MSKLISQYAWTFILFVAVIVVGATLVIVSQNVYEKENTVRQKGRELVAQEWELRSLKAEWAYLSRPDRLEELSVAMGTTDQSVIVAMPNTAPMVEISPVRMDVPTPHNKPFYVIRAVQESEPAVTKSAPAKQASEADFSSLLKTIGGGQ